MRLFPQGHQLTILVPQVPTTPGQLYRWLVFGGGQISQCPSESIQRGSGRRLEWSMRHRLNYTTITSKLSYFYHVSLCSPIALPLSWFVWSLLIPLDFLKLIFPVQLSSSTLDFMNSLSIILFLKSKNHHYFYFSSQYFVQHFILVLYTIVIYYLYQHFICYLVCFL